MLTLDGAATAQLSQPAYGIHWLIEADFTTGMQRVTTAPINITSGGNTYTGLGNQVSVSDVSENSDVSAAKVTIGITLADPALASLFMGNISSYRGRAARLYLQVFNEKFVPTGAKVLRWAGYMNPVEIKPGREGQAGRVEIPCTRAGMNRFRNFRGLRMTHEQHIKRFPGDLGLQYMPDLISKPALWLSKRFQEI